MLHESNLLPNVTRTKRNLSQTHHHVVFRRTSRPLDEEFSDFSNKNCSFIIFYQINLYVVLYKMFFFYSKCSWNRIICPKSSGLKDPLTQGGQNAKHLTSFIQKYCASLITMVTGKNKLNLLTIKT